MKMTDILSYTIIKNKYLNSSRCILEAMKKWSYRNNAGVLEIDFNHGPGDRKAKMKMAAYFLALLPLAVFAAIKHPLTLLPVGLVLVLIVKPLLWQTFGKEIWFFKKSSVGRSKDYKYWRGKVDYFEFDELNINYIKVPGKKKANSLDDDSVVDAYLKIVTNDKDLISGEKVNLSEMEDITRTIAQHYNAA